MARERTGAGDPARTLELLWRASRELDAPQRGPRPTLSIDAVVEAAIELADADGIDALSMRSLAQRFGVAPMALYTYVPGKAELLDLMVDHAYRTMPRSTPRGASWRARIAEVADDNLALHRRHPWLARVATHRPPLGPGLMAKYDHELRALEGTGLDDVEMDAALTFVLGFVASCASAAVDERAAERESAMADQAWWAANAPLLARVLDPTRFPVAARVGAAAGEAHGAAYSPEHAYAFGLERVLDGLEVLITRRASGTSAKPKRSKPRRA
ncbi:TetR/AcrR family transcriptional regulator [Sandaracinus amylolyticus]|uniref:TetR/AcrR family transcriptional regulator n=1 Tax=Sandaracinus amylolyticus TaxID=927083 RepID=UPI003AF3D31E|nr:Transcriptional regulator [Sandaracinus amylolyticus]